MQIILQLHYSTLLSIFLEIFWKLLKFGCATKTTHNLCFQLFLQLTFQDLHVVSKTTTKASSKDLGSGMQVLDGDVSVSDAVRILVHFIHNPAQSLGAKALLVPQGAEEDDKRLHGALAFRLGLESQQVCIACRMAGRPLVITSAGYP